MEALGFLKVKLAELDGELCALYGDGAPVFTSASGGVQLGRSLRAHTGIREYYGRGCLDMVRRRAY